MKLLFFTPLFYWLKVILIVIELIQANKKGGSKKVVSSTFEKTTDELVSFFIEYRYQYWYRISELHSIGTETLDFLVSVSYWYRK